MNTRNTNFAKSTLNYSKGYGPSTIKHIPGILKSSNFVSSSQQATEDQTKSCFSEKFGGKNQGIKFKEIVNQYSQYEQGTNSNRM